MAGNNIEKSVSFVLNELGLHAAGYALPQGVPTLGGQRVAEMKGETVGTGLTSVMNQSPLTLRRENGEAYTFPLDPVIAVSGKNVIARRYVAKGSVRGSVKESFSQDDYEVTITGLLNGGTAEELNMMVEELKELCETGEALLVENDWLTEGFGIVRIVVESYSFPHTKGLANQGYSMKCYSDESVKILEEV